MGKLDKINKGPLNVSAQAFVPYAPPQAAERQSCLFHAVRAVGGLFCSLGVSWLSLLRRVNPNYFLHLDRMAGPVWLGVP